MTEIPTLEMQRLTLRPHHLDDFEVHAALWANEDVVRFISGAPSTREQSWARMLRIAGMWHHMGFGFLAIVEKASGRFIGEAGFLEARREMEPSIEGTMEVGWALMPSAQGRGYATEALTARPDRLGGSAFSGKGNELHHQPRQRGVAQGRSQARLPRDGARAV